MVVKKVASFIQRKVRLFALLSLCETILFAGLPYGWGTLLYVFKEEGVYSDLCHQQSYNTSSHSNLTGGEQVISIETSDNSTLSCSEQDQQFNLWFSIALGIGTAANVIIGRMTQKIGAVKTRIIFIPVVIGGALCLAFTSKDLPWLILPGLSFLSIGGFSLLISNIRVGSFLTAGSSIYIGTLSGSYDTSSIMTRVIKALYQNGISRKYTFVGFSILHLVISGTNTFVHSRYNVKSEDVDMEVQSGITNPADVLEDEQEESNKSKSYKTYGSEHKKEIISSSVPQQSILEPNLINDKHVNHDNGIGESRIGGKDITDQHEKIQELTLKQHMSSSLYVIHTIFLSILILKFVFFLGSINKQLEIVLGEKKEVEHFTDVLSYTLMGGIVGSFVSGSLLEWQKKVFSNSDSEKHRTLMPQVFPLLICAVLVISLSALTFISSSNAFYGQFINLVLLRSFIYAVNMGFITNVFPVKFTGVLFGFVITVSGIIGLLQYALFVWMDSYEGALTHVNWLLLGLAVFTLLHPLNVFIQARRH